MSEQHFAFTNGGIEELSHVPPQYMGEAMDLSISMTLLPARSLAFSIRGILLVYHPDTQRLLLPWGMSFPSLSEGYLDARPNRYRFLSNNQQRYFASSICLIAHLIPEV